MPFNHGEMEFGPDSHSLADRKVACDQGRPACRNCVASDRTCQGYGLRLSWPTTKSRRSIEHRIQAHHNTKINSSDTKHTYFINTSNGHVETFYIQDPTYMG